MHIRSSYVIDEACWEKGKEGEVREGEEEKEEEHEEKEREEEEEELENRKRRRRWGRRRETSKMRQELIGMVG